MYDFWFVWCSSMYDKSRTLKNTRQTKSRTLKNTRQIKSRT
jgi:hypothetical protein